MLEVIIVLCLRILWVSRRINSLSCALNASKHLMHAGSRPRLAVLARFDFAMELISRISPSIVQQ